MFLATRLAQAALPVLASLACLAAPRGAAAAADQGAQIAAACASCHRLDGRDTGIPPVVGLDEQSIVQAMLAYRSGQRAGQIMKVVAASLSPEELAAVAHYLAARRPAAQHR
jgi:sulfide dehydrogenase cytochrome subunit